MSRAASACVIALVAVCAALVASSAQAVVAMTKHNLSTSGPGTVMAATETEICVFCHTPHNGAPSGPLWNRRNPGGPYTPYTSSTQRAAVGQPTGASLMCLSCHDGTIALGDVLSRPAITMAGGVTTLRSGPSAIGTDLADDHPVSFAYTGALASANGELVNPATLTGRVRLDASGQLQCTSCHDPHDDANGKFLVTPNVASSLCQTCHVKQYWSASDHRNSTATWNGAGADPWPHTSGTTVADNACENCHRPHTATGKLRLLNALTEENNCYPCHNGNVAAKNIQVEFNKSSIHPVVATTAVHDPTEPAVVANRHVECVDCHNPHAAKSGGGSPSGPLTGVRGITINGGESKPANYSYEICFRCHADSPGKPAPRVTRQIAQTNTRLEFSTSNPSFHPVAGPAVPGGPVPSLIPPLATTSTITCTDCHNNNAGPGAGGTGPNGPHGSTYAPLLERQYRTSHSRESGGDAYALCYKCHSRASILSNASFKISHETESGGPLPRRGIPAPRCMECEAGGHPLHVVMAGAPCSTCHDAHGISAMQGNPINNARLINFDTSAVRPTAGGVLKYEWTGPDSGRCYLVCHGVPHNPLCYGTGPMPGCGEMIGSGKR